MVVKGLLGSFRSIYSRGFSTPSVIQSRRQRRVAKNRRLLIESLEGRRVFATAILNEININPNGTDQPFEFVEIKGTPGATLSNLYFVSIEGDSPGSGVVDLFVDLSGQQIGSNGLLIITSTSGGFTIPVGTTVVTTTAFDIGGSALENGTNTFALVSSTVAPVTTADWDTGTTGILTIPSGGFVVDAVGWSDGGASDLVYGANLTSVGAQQGAMSRFQFDNRPTTAAAWYWGAMSAPNSSTAYTTTVASRSGNFPVGGALTPGDVNAPGTNVAPVALADTYNVAPSGTINIAAGAGVLANDSDANGALSLLSAIRLTNPTNAATFTFNSDGSFQYVSNGTLGLDSFTYQATDLNLLSNIVNVTINVAPLFSDPPVLVLPAGVLNYSENDPAVLIAPAATLTDTDSPNFSTGALTVDFQTNGQAEDRLEVRNQGTGSGQISTSGSVVAYEGVTIGAISGGVGVVPLTVDLNNNATPVAVQALIRNITYRNVSDTPVTLARTARFVVTDGDGGTSVAQTQSILVSAVNDSPVLGQSRTSTFYAAGSGNAVTLDGLVSLTDIDLLDFASGVLTATISANSESGDSLAVRNVGNGAGQVGVSGSVVSFGGVSIGTTAGGASGSPLTVTFNSSASQEAVQAVVRSIAFQTTSTRLVSATRTVTVGLTDGDGGTSNSIAYTLSQSQVRRAGFQEAVDNGQGVYTGAGDTMLYEVLPGTNLPQGNNITGEGLLVDFDPEVLNSAVLLKFDSIFGSNAGQIPIGASIVSARLVLATKNPGDGGSFHRMLTSWDANTATWSSIPPSLNESNFFVRNDGVTAAVAFESQVGTSAGTGDAAAGVTTIGVTSDIQAWSNGQANFGWLIQGWQGRADGWGFTASEDDIASNRPKLEVEWVPATIASASYRNGENGYSGTNDTTLSAANPTVDNSASATVQLGVDFNDQLLPASNETQMLIRFDGINGSLAGQVPSGALVHSAVLTLASTVSNAPGDGGTFHALLQPWASVPSWDGFVGGISADGIEAASVPTTVAGNASRSPNVEGGWNNFDLTSDVQAFANGSLANNGWAVLPWTNGTDGWTAQPSETTTVNQRPQLRVFFTPVGVTVNPVSGLQTSELGATASFSIALNTPPTANVTIPLSSSNVAEGTLSVSSVTFTSANWDIPQTVTISGINDGLVDGNIAYSIVTAAATSTDPNYNGLNPSDVTVTNIGNGGSNATPTISNIGSQNTAFQTPTVAIPVTVFDAETPLSSLVLSVTSSSNAALVPVGNIVFGGTGGNRTLVVTPANGQTGSSNIVIRVTDGSGAFSEVTFTLTVQPAPAGASIASRNVFYNNASGFGTSGANATDLLLNPVAAIDPTKSALLPGGQASVANYTNYSRGINGLVIDITNPADLAAINAGSFQFATWSTFTDATPNFLTITPTVTVSTFATGGQGGSARVKLTFADRAIENSWLRVTVLANPLTTGLAANDVFYFGNARFDVNPAAPAFTSQVSINVLDTNQVRAQNGQNPGLVSNVFDVDRSGAVNVLDTNATRAGNGVSSLRFFNAPASLQLARSASTPAILSSSVTKKSLIESTDEFFSQF